MLGGLCTDGELATILLLVVSLSDLTRFGQVKTCPKSSLWCRKMGDSDVVNSALPSELEWCPEQCLYFSLINMELTFRIPL